VAREFLTGIVPDASGGSSVFQAGAEVAGSLKPLISGSNVTIDPGAFWIKRSTTGLLERFVVLSQITKALPALPSGGNERLVEVVANVPTSGNVIQAADISVTDGADDAGGTLDNRNGAAHAGASTTRPAITDGELIADVLQDASTRVLRDRRPWARGFFWSGARAATVTFTTSPTLIHADLYRRFECGGGLVQMLLLPSGMDAGASYVYTIRAWVDGAVDTASSARATVNTGETGDGRPYPVWCQPSAGSHMIGPSVQGNVADSWYTRTDMLIREIGPTGNNGTA
jgi:hypothetical protein